MKKILKRTMLILLACAGAVSYCQEATALPQGSYLNTCNKCKMLNNGELQCECKNAAGEYVPSILKASVCKNKISNCDGALYCGTCP